MADLTYAPKTYRKDGGDTHVIANGGKQEIESGGLLKITGVEMTVSGDVAAGVPAIELNHATVVVAAVIPDLADHAGLLIIKNTSASGTAAHTVTATAGTFDGTNNVVTLNALNECIAIWVDSAGNGTILENVGTVAIS